MIVLEKNLARNLYYILFFYTFALIFQDMTLPGLLIFQNFSLSELLGIFLLFISLVLLVYQGCYRKFIIKLWPRKKRNKFYLMTFPFICYFFFEILLSIYFNSLNLFTIKLIFKRILDSFLILLPIIIINSTERRRSIFEVYLTVTFIIALITIVVGLGLLKINFVRSADILKQRNELMFGVFSIRNMGLFEAFNSGAICFGISMTYIIDKYKKNIIRLKDLIIASLIMIAIIPTDSRSVMLTVFVALLFSVAKIEKKSKVYNAIAIIIFMMITHFTIIILTSTVKELENNPYIDALVTYRTEGKNIDPRVFMYIDGIKKISKSPFLGVGAGNEYYTYKIAGEETTYIMHNVFLQAILRGGVGGWIYTFFMIYIAFHLFREVRKKKIPKTSFIYFSVWLIPAMFSGPLGAGTQIFTFSYGLISANYIHDEYPELSLLSIRKTND